MGENIYSLPLNDAAVDLVIDDDKQLVDGDENGIIKESVTQ